MADSSPSDVEADDNALMELAGQGNREAFGRVYDRLATPLFSLALQMLSDRSEAEDAFVEGMEAIWRQAPKFDPTRASAFTWAVMIFRRRVIDRGRRSQVRKKSRDQIEMAEKSAGLQGAEDHLPARRDECRLVREAVDGLDPLQSELLRMSFFDGMTHQEISDKSGKPLGTVKTTIRRALLELRRQMTGKGVDQ